MHKRKSPRNSQEFVLILLSERKIVQQCVLLKRYLCIYNDYKCEHYVESREQNNCEIWMPKRFSIISNSL